MSVAIVVDMGPRGVVLVADSGCYLGDTRSSDVQKVYTTPLAAIAMTGHVKALQFAAEVLAADPWLGHAAPPGAAPPPNAALLFATTLEQRMRYDGAGGESWPRDYECNTVLVLRHAPPGQRLWAAGSDMVLRPVVTGPGCSPYPVACVGSGAGYAMGAWVAATKANKASRPQAMAKRAILAACELCAWCRVPVVPHHIWAV